MEDEDYGNDAQDNEYLNSPFSDSLKIFMESKAFLQLQKAGFSTWGDEDTFREALETGDSAAQSLAAELLSEELQELQPSVPSKLDSGLSDSTGCNSSKVGMHQENKSGKKNPKKGDFKIVRGALSFSNGTPFRPGNSPDEDDSTKKKFLRILNERTTVPISRYKNVSASTIIQDRHAGVSLHDRNVYESWARVDPGNEFTFDRKFKQPPNIFRGTKSDKNSRYYRLPFPTHAQGSTGSINLSNLPGELFSKSKKFIPCLNKF